MMMPFSQPQPPIIYSAPADVASRLHALGLTLGLLWDVVHYGLGYHAECTPHDPPSAPGFLLWDKGIRGLRDHLIPQGWKSVTEHNYPTVVHPSGLYALSVAGGDERTGIPDADANPSTRTDKGRLTREAVAQNQSSFWVVRPDLTPPAKQTWILLIHVNLVQEVVRAELSLPAGMDEDNHLSWWHERIILGSIPYDSTLFRSLTSDDDDEGGELDIDVSRRAG